MDSLPKFNSIEDECRYWKERSLQYDVEMKAKKSEIKDLTSNLIMLDLRYETLKLKQDTHAIVMGKMERELEAVKKERDSMKVYLKQLEEKNDKLEQEHQTLLNSIENFGMMLDRSFEKNALLKMETDIKKLLLEKFYRLMGETKKFKDVLNIVMARPIATNSINISMNSSIVANGELAVATNAKSVSVSPSSGSLVSSNIRYQSLNNSQTITSPEQDRFSKK